MRFVISIYSSFPLTGQELDCPAGEGGKADGCDLTASPGAIMTRRLRKRLRPTTLPRLLVYMNLDEAQKQRVTEWIAQGLSLSEIQNRLASDLGIRMTYMEVRFLIDDLKLKPRDKERPKSPADLKSDVKGTDAPGKNKDILANKQDDEPAAGNVSVKVDQIARPGALASGQVTFSDGKSADWYLDQYGRLGLVPKQKDHKPSEQDLMTFQAELQTELAKLGF